MSNLTACALSFCSTLNEGRYFYADHAVTKATALHILNAINVYGLSFIHDELNVHVEIPINHELKNSFRTKFYDIVRQLKVATEAAKETGRDGEPCFRRYRTVARKNITSFISSLEPCFHQFNPAFVNVTITTSNALLDAVLLQQQLEYLIQDCKEHHTCSESRVNNVGNEYTRIRTVHTDLLEKRANVINQVPTVIECMQQQYGRIEANLDVVLEEGMECIASRPTSHRITH